MPSDHLLYARELELRDQAIAHELDAVRALEDRVIAIRNRAGEVRNALERVPVVLADLETRRGEADHAVAGARAELADAAARFAALESGRRGRGDELERARKEWATAQDELDDVLARRARLDELLRTLERDEHAFRAEAAALAEAAGELATAARHHGRVSEVARHLPGRTLPELDDWGGRLRSALFVARGTLEREREQIVVEANLLGTSVLAEELGASGVALVRRRLEAHLAPGAR